MYEFIGGDRRLTFGSVSSDRQVGACKIVAKLPRRQRESIFRKAGRAHRRYRGFGIWKEQGYIDQVNRVETSSNNGSQSLFIANWSFRLPHPLEGITTCPRLLHGANCGRSEYSLRHQVGRCLPQPTLRSGLNQQVVGVCCACDLFAAFISDTPSTHRAHGIWTTFASLYITAHTK